MNGGVVFFHFNFDHGSTVLLEGVSQTYQALNSFRVRPEREPLRPSTKKETARMGSILAMYATTSSSLLYAYPQMLRRRIMMVANTTPPHKVMQTTTRAASLAASGCPAPSSLETRVLVETRN